MHEEVYIWITNWDERQTFQLKRGKPWAPPWVKLFTRILDDPEYLELSPETRSLLVGLWALFARSHGTVTKDTRRLSKQLHQRVTEHQLKTLNHAGFIVFCSGTVLEQRRAAFWNRSTLEEKRQEENNPPSPTPTPTPNGNHPADADADLPFDLPPLDSILKDIPA